VAACTVGDLEDDTVLRVTLTEPAALQPLVPGRLVDLRA
jgi:hypothetical protein